MKITLVYIYPLDGQGHHHERAIRFIDSYNKFPPGVAHDTIIVCNGGTCSEQTRFLFGSLLNVSLVRHDDTGQDIGGYVTAARGSDADVMVFCGGNSYFRIAGWMGRVRDSFLKYGDTLYGCSGNQGGHVQPHIRTTGFWCRPGLLLEYCPNVIPNERRYEFEHGVTCFSNWIRNRGKIPYVVAWNMERELSQCDSIPGGYHSNQQEHLLIGDRLTGPPYYPVW